MAQQESENISSHVLLGLKMKKDRGELIGYNGCYGYNYNLETKEITVNEQEAEIVRYMFERIEDCFVQGYRILCNDNKKVIETFLENIENILKENTTETLVSKLEKDKERINKKLNNLLELNLEGRINKEQYTLKFDELNTELIKVENKIQSLLKKTNRTESIKLRLNKFKRLFKDMEIMSKFDKDVFECLIDKVIIGETKEDGTINPYTIRFICKNGTEINCKDKFTATSDKQALNNIATSDNHHTLSV